MTRDGNTERRHVERIVCATGSGVMVVSLLFLTATLTTLPSPWSVGRYALAVAVASSWIGPLRWLLGPRAARIPGWLPPVLAAVVLAAVGAALASLPNLLTATAPLDGVSTPAEAPRSPP